MYQDSFLRFLNTFHFKVFCGCSLFSCKIDFQIKDQRMISNHGSIKKCQYCKKRGKFDLFSKLGRFYKFRGPRFLPPPPKKKEKKTA